MGASFAAQTPPAVAIESLTGVVAQIPDLFPLAYFQGLPKWCLVVNSRTHLKGIQTPKPVVCSAWTVTVDDSLNEGPEDKYLQWMFKVGVSDWIEQIGRAVEIIQTVRDKVGATALFEFDEERNWFGPYTPFTPKSMREMFLRMKEARYKIELSL